MNLLKKLFRPRTFEGRIVRARFVTFEYNPITGTKHNFDLQKLTLHLRYDTDSKGYATQILRSVNSETCDVTLQDSEGNRKTFRVHGELPEIGSTQRYNLRNLRTVV